MKADLHKGRALLHLCSCQDAPYSYWALGPTLSEGEPASSSGCGRDGIQVAHHEGTGQGGVVLVSSYTAFNHPVDFVCVLSRSVTSNSLLPHVL